MRSKIWPQRECPWASSATPYGSLLKTGAGATEITAALSELTPPGRVPGSGTPEGAGKISGAPESEEEEKVPPGKGGKKK